jgi:hypothetical protein
MIPLLNPPLFQWISCQAPDESELRLRFVISTLDHEPAHVHIVGGEGQAKINLLGAGGRPALVWSVASSGRT